MTTWIKSAMAWTGLAAALLLSLAAAAPAAAQPAAAPVDVSTIYAIGQRVEVKPTPWQDVWEEGVVRDYSYDRSQLIIKSASADRAFNLQDVRPLGSGGATGGAAGRTANAAGNGAPPQNARNTTAPGQTNGGRRAPNTGGPTNTPLAAAEAGPRSAGGRMGERVSVSVSGVCCYDGTIIGAGQGALTGYWLIHFDNPASTDSYAKDAFVYARGTRNPPPGQGAAPGRGTRCVMTYRGGIPVCLPVAAPG